ncbi:IPT/TIG domain-containing protein [bacterium]|nr:IPT/TIG domain-containing protein [bacterium]
MLCLLFLLGSCGGGGGTNNDNMGPRPSISNLSRSSANIGDEVVISGSNFGTSQSGSSVRLNGIDFQISSWTSTSINAVVSSGMTSGIVVVTVGGLNSESGSNAQLFIPNAPSTTPIINAISPDFGRRGQDKVTLIGSGFGSSEGTSGVYFSSSSAVSQGGNYVKAEVSVVNVGGVDVPQWTDSAVTVFVPATAANNALVYIQVGENQSNSKPFNSLAPDSSANPPSIGGIDPLSGGVGDLITITGSGFGDTPDGSVVTINGRQMEIVFWSDSSISVRIPEGAATGSIRVTVGGEFDEFVTPFEVGNKPVITGVSPNNVRIGGSITVRGSNFGFQQGTGELTVGGKSQTVADSNGSQAGWVDNEILIPALGSVTPDGDGNVAVVVSNDAGLSSEPFLVKITSDLTGFADVTPTAGVQGLTQFSYSVSVVGGSGNYSYQLIPDATDQSIKGAVQNSSPFTYVYDKKGTFQGQVLITDKDTNDSVVVDVNSKVLVVGPNEPVITGMGTSDWNQFGQDSPNLFMYYDNAGEESYKQFSFGSSTWFASDRTDHIEGGSKLNVYRRDLKAFGPEGATNRPLGYRYVDAGGNGSRIRLVGLNFGDTPGTLTLAKGTANEVVVDGSTGNNLDWTATAIEFDLPASTAKDLSGKIEVITASSNAFVSIDPLICSTHKLSIQPEDGLVPDGTMQFNGRDLLPPQIPGKVGNKTYLFWVVQANYVDPFTSSPASGLVPVVTPFEVDPTSTTISFDMNRLSGNLSIEVVNPADSTESAVTLGTMITTDGTQHYFYVWSGALGTGTNQEIALSGVMSEAYAVAMGTAVVTGPNANLSASVTSGAAPLNVTFNAAGSSSDAAPGVYNYTLSYGDASADDTWDQGTTPPNQPHVYTADGNYTATLTVERVSDGAMAQDTVLIQVGGGGGGDGFATFNGTVYLFDSPPIPGNPPPPKSPLAGIEVRLKDFDGNILDTATSGADGKYSFTNVAFQNDTSLWLVTPTVFDTGSNTTWLPGSLTVFASGWTDGHVETLVDLNDSPDA